MSKRTRYTSADDDDIQRIAREDHDHARQFQYTDFDHDTGGFGEPNFDEYRSPIPVGVMIRLWNLSLRMILQE